MDEIKICKTIHLSSHTLPENYFQSKPTIVVVIKIGENVHTKIGLASSQSEFFSKI
jgi:hypothetical protein